MSILCEEPCDNLPIVNILFFVCKRSYSGKDIDFTKHVVAMDGFDSRQNKYKLRNWSISFSTFKFYISILFYIQYSTQRNIEKLLFIRRIREICHISFTFSVMILVLNRILGLVKINNAVMKVIIRRFKKSSFLVQKIESWILHSFIIWKNDPWF